MKQIAVAIFALPFLISAGCSGNSASEPEATVVYFDTATKTPVVSEPSAQSPAVHPFTGKRTLVPAAWCSRCQAWHAAPPVEQVQRNPKALVCAKTGARLTLDGPRP